MVSHRNRLIAWTVLVVVAAGMVVDAATGGEAGWLYLAPGLLLAVPLVVGRYLGEDQLVDLVTRQPIRRRRTVLRSAGPRSYARVMQRGGRLVASGMAKRPPPRAPLPHPAA
jgi:hypothetical protein